MADNPARRGDIVAIPFRHSVTYCFGSGRGTETTETVRLATVTSVTRDGQVKGAALACGVPVRDIPRGIRVGSAGKLRMPVADIVNQIGDTEFPDFGSALAALAPYRA